MREDTRSVGRRGARRVAVAAAAAGGLAVAFALVIPVSPATAPSGAP